MTEIKIRFGGKPTGRNAKAIVAHLEAAGCTSIKVNPSDSGSMAVCDAPDDKIDGIRAFVGSSGLRPTPHYASPSPWLSLADHAHPQS